MFSKTLVLLVSILCTFFTSCQAISIGKGLVRVDDQNYGLFQNDIPLNLTDTKLSIAFTLLSDKKNPESFINPKQVTITLSTENVTSELYFYPTLIEGKVYESNIFLKDISKYFLSQDEIQISVITGDDSDSSLNTILLAGKLLPSEKLKTDKTTDKPLRFTQLDEIRHIFKSPPKNLPGFISTQFVFLLLILFIVLLLAWNYFEAANINNINKFGLSSFLFLISIFGFEYAFFDYYLGTSIFTSLYRFALIGVFSIYFGSKALRDMYELRSKNLR
jgi:oligosaccharyltransferase complex subunit delta (ribophorin II)